MIDFITNYFYFFTIYMNIWLKINLFLFMNKAVESTHLYI